MSRRTIRPLGFVTEPLEVRVLLAGVPIATGVPAHSSLPGAPAYLYLDFDGTNQFHGSTPPEDESYDLDGDPTTFSPFEQQVMAEVWSHVADAFSPFNLNVTTVDPGPADNVAGKTLNILIGGPQPGSTGGGAFQGSFITPGLNWAFVYSGQPAATAEIAIHEAGHSFNLGHQASFDAAGNIVAEYRFESGPVGPIMGAGAIGRNLWSDGPVNQFPKRQQDDMAIIAGTRNGFGYRPDDHGDTAATATSVPIASGSGVVSGVLHYHTEQDWFTFNWPGGPLSITAEGAPHGPLFLSTLQLSNSSGAVLATAVGEQTWKMIRSNLDPGTYRLRVTSTPYTDSLGTRAYGNVGQYTLRIKAGALAEAQVPYFLQPFSVTNTGPTTIEAEDFDRGGEGVSYQTLLNGYQQTPHRGNEGVLIYGVPSEGGYVVGGGGLFEGDWIEYSIDVQQAGAYDLAARLASTEPGGRVHVEIDGVAVSGSVAVPVAWQTTPLSRVNLTSGPHVLRFVSDANTAGGYPTGDVNWLRFTPAPPPGTQTPFNDTPFSVTRTGPTTIQAEDFDRGGEGVAYHDLTAANTGGAYRPTEGVDIKSTPDSGGGFRLSDAAAGEWLEYAINVSTTGAYRLEFRAGASAAGGAFHAEVGGVNVTGQLVVPNTGSYDTMQTILSPTVQLTAGVHVLRLSLDANTSTGAVGGFNWLRVAPVNESTPVMLRATAAAYVRDGSYAGQNFGTSTELQLKKSGAGSNREIYLKFDVGAISSVSAAKLRLFGRIDSSTEQPSVAVYGSSNTSWSETGVNWNNRPAAGAAALATATVATSIAKWYEWDVTSFLQAQKAAGATSVTLVVRSLTTTTPHMIFSSDEAAANRPELLVTPSGTPPPPQQAIVVSTNQLAVAEGGTASFTVALAAQPTSNVTVSIGKLGGVPNDADLATGTGSLTFTPSNWNVPQSVVVAAAQDADSVNGTATFNVSAAGLTSKTVGASEVDDDTTTAPITLRAAADAHVRDGSYAAQNFGASTELQLKKSAAGSNREIFLKFDLSTLTTVSSAKLRLFGRIDSASEQPSVGVFSASGTSWTEAGLTWNNRPPAGTTALATTTVATSTQKWYEWDVTSYLQAQKAAGATFVTLVLRSLTTTTPHMIFSSDEATGNRPELVVT